MINSNIKGLALLALTFIASSLIIWDNFLMNFLSEKCFKLTNFGKQIDKIKGKNPILKKIQPW